MDESQSWWQAHTSSELAWSTYGVRGQPRLHSETSVRISIWISVNLLFNSKQQITGFSSHQAGCHNFSGKDEEVAFESTMNFSDIYHSDEEYFRKLKDLKAVHEETMSKLEKMYQDKLNIKDIQAGFIRDGISDSSSR